MPRLRIAYLNPYLGKAEDQSFRSLEQAAPGLGIELVQLTPQALSDEDDFAFVISVTTEIPKRTRHPQFLSAHGGRQVYLHDARLFGNTLSYDGYLCIADSLRPFFAALSPGLGHRLTEPGYFYMSPQSLPHQHRAARPQDLALCYFGTNWDRRTERLFRRLAETRDDVRYYGPPGSWDRVDPKAYHGEAPFDGVAVQEIYRRHGVGFVSLSERHLFDDVISNRLFEIASVEANAICPRTPWIEAAFGEAVFYYDPYAPVETILGQVDEAMIAIRERPEAAAAMAADSRRIFEDRFDAAHMLANAVAYFQAWSGRASPPSWPADDLSARPWSGRRTECERALVAAARALPADGTQAFEVLAPRADALWAAMREDIAVRMEAWSSPGEPLALELGERVEALSGRADLVCSEVDIPQGAGLAQIDGRLPFSAPGYVVLHLAGGEAGSVRVLGGDGDSLADGAPPLFRRPLEVWVPLPNAALAASVAWTGPPPARLFLVYEGVALGRHGLGLEEARGVMRSAQACAVRGGAWAALAADRSGRPVGEAGGGLTVRIGTMAWSYTAAIDLAGAGPSDCLKVTVNQAEEAVYLQLVDQACQPVGERTLVTSGPAECWFQVGAAVRLIVQAGPAPTDGRLVIGSVEAFPPKS